VKFRSKGRSEAVNLNQYFRGNVEHVFDPLAFMCENAHLLCTLSKKAAFVSNLSVIAQFHHYILCSSEITVFVNWDIQ